MFQNCVKQKFQFLILALLGGALLAAPLQAEIVTLKDGTVINGRIIGQSREEIRLRTPKETMTIPKSQLKKIQWVRETAAQKAARREALLKKQEAARLEKERLEKEKSADEEKQRILAELEAQIQAEKAQLAKERAERASALRELVENKTMEKPKDEPISYWDFAWRSMVLPGWGHFTIERPTMGSLYMGATAALLINLYQRDRDVRAAMKQNHEETQLNYALSIIPNTLPIEWRAAYGIYANGKAMTGYEKKVKRANYSVYLLQAFYGLQLLHIIYNGFAWEKGLLIVNDDSQRGSVTPNLAVAPDIGEDGKIGGALRAGVTFRF